MKYRFFRVVIFFIICLNISCKENYVQNITALPIKDTLQGKAVNIQSDLLKPAKMVNISDRFLVVISDVKKSIFKVFSLPRVKFLVAFQVWEFLNLGTPFV